MYYYQLINDQSIVGTANALVAGWGNVGGGATYAIMVSLYDHLRSKMGTHKAWRVAFAIVPVPALLFVALITVVFGTDHPKGKWAQRQASILIIVPLLSNTPSSVHRHDNQPGGEAIDLEADKMKGEVPVSEVVVAVNEPLTLDDGLKMLGNPLTWLPTLA